MIGFPFSSTHSVVLPSSIDFLTFSASFLASSLAFSFCSGVKFGSLSMFLIFSSSSFSTDFLAFSLSSGDGVYGLSLSPSDGFVGLSVDGFDGVSFLAASLAFSTSSGVLASFNAFLASSAVFLASSLAFSFCSGVRLGSSSIFLTLFSKAFSISLEASSLMSLYT